jgi:hypothetical protein
MSKSAAALTKRQHWALPWFAWFAWFVSALPICGRWTFCRISLLYPSKLHLRARVEPLQKPWKPWKPCDSGVGRSAPPHLDPVTKSTVRAVGIISAAPEGSGTVAVADGITDLLLQAFPGSFRCDDRLGGAVGNRNSRRLACRSRCSSVNSLLISLRKRATSLA